MSWLCTFCGIEVYGSHTCPPSRALVLLAECVERLSVHLLRNFDRDHAMLIAVNERLAELAKILKPEGTS